MSDHIPFEIQEEIIKRLPIKSLIQFRSVSKPWKSFIDTSEFITNYHRTQQRHHLLVTYHKQVSYGNLEERKYVSIVDDETFPQQKIPLTVPVSVNQLIQPKILGSSQGLLCLYEDFDHSVIKTAVIWNPFIRKSVTISVYAPLGLDLSSNTVVAFGVTPDTCDPKLVKISYDDNCETVIEVFTLSTMSWKRLTTNFPFNSISFGHNHVAIDRFIYWRAYDLRWHTDDHYHGLKHIISFDMITEEFKELDLPDSFALDHFLFPSKAREESLAVVLMNGITKIGYSCDVTPCIETLLLLDH